MVVKFNQYWDLIPGRKTEYSDFIREEFLPTLKLLGIEVVSGWYILVGKGPHIISEGRAKDIQSIERLLISDEFKILHGRLANFAQNYMSRVLAPTGRVAKEHGRTPPPTIVKFNQSWNINPGCAEQYDLFIKEKHIPTMETLGITIAAGWNVLIGAGPTIISEGHAQDLETIAKALSDERYRLLIVELQDLVSDYESRILVRHRLFMEAIEEVYGSALRQVSEDQISAMYGPMVG